MGFRDLSLVNDSLLANKLGNCYTTRILLFTRFSRLGFSLIVLLRRLKIQDQALMLGEVFSREGMLFKERLGGELGMVKPLKFCMIIGSLGNTPRWFPSPKIPSMEEATVDTPLDPATQQRSHGIIDGIFAPEEADLIKKIPLARVGMLCFGL